LRHVAAKAHCGAIDGFARKAHVIGLIKHHQESLARGQGLMDPKPLRQWHFERLGQYRKAKKA